MYNWQPNRGNFFWDNKTTGIFLNNTAANKIDKLQRTARVSFYAQMIDFTARSLTIR